MDEALAARLQAYLAGDPAALRDPYPLYRALREQAPVAEVGPVVVLSRYGDVKAVARDSARFSSRVFTSDRDVAAVAAMTPEQRDDWRVLAAYDETNVAHSDGEQHARLRRIAHRAFVPARIAELRGRVAAFADELLDEMEATADPDGTVNLMDFAYRLPLMVVTDLLGVPPGDRARIHHWSKPIGRSRGVVDPVALHEARRAVDAFRTYLHEHVVPAARASRGSELVAALMSAEEDERLTLDELTSMFVLLLFAGHETTTNLIGLGMLELLRSPGQWQLLVGDADGRAAAAVEEILRHVSPVQLIQRVASEEVELHGVRIASGRHVIAFLGAANRDPAAFPRPDAFDLERDPAPGHLDFGFGPHYCLGTSLARLEGEVALAGLARRHPGLRLATDPSTLAWAGNAMLRTLSELRVALG